MPSTERTAALTPFPGIEKSKQVDSSSASSRPVVGKVSVAQGEKGVDCFVCSRSRHPSRSGGRCLDIARLVNESRLGFNIIADGRVLKTAAIRRGDVRGRGSDCAVWGLLNEDIIASVF